MSVFRMAMLLTYGICCLATGATASDWPQFMKTASHTGDACDEQLQMPLELGGPDTTRRRDIDVARGGWREGVRGGSNGNRVLCGPECRSRSSGNRRRRETLRSARIRLRHASRQERSSYGTTAGNLHILDAGSGATIKTIAFGQPILGSITLANDSIYLQTLDAVVHCLDLDGNPRWRWDHYNVYGDQQTPNRKAHYGGVTVSVVGQTGGDGNRLRPGLRGGHGDRGETYLDATSADRYRLLARGNGHRRRLRLLLLSRARTATGPFLRVSLNDGSFQQARDLLKNQWAVLASPAVRDETAYFSRQAFGVTAHRFAVARPELVDLV